MKRKKLIIIAAVIGVLLVLLIAVPSLINVDNYRPTIEAALGSSLGRQVQIGHLHLSLLSRTISAEDLTIKQLIAALNASREERGEGKMWHAGRA